MKFLHYNIFAHSLGSNCIPWVMTISNEWKEIIKNKTNETFENWLKNTFTIEYLKHFHKNYYSGNKVKMRQLWSQKVIHQNDLPNELNGLTFISENRVKYQKPTNNNNQNNNQNNENNLSEVEEFFATTLPGILDESIPEFSTDLYNHIMEIESNYDWNIRGPRIYHEIIRNEPDIIALSEYDIHDIIANYRNDSTPESFSDSMKETGYSGFLLKAPAKHELSGLGFFWKTNSFELVNEYNVTNQLYSQPFVNTIEVQEDNQDNYSSGAHNYDLHEYWHKLFKKLSLLSSSSSSSLSSLSSLSEFTSIYEEMSINDRRHVGFIRLRHKLSNKILLVVYTHLMTNSRDSASTNEYPGEVRCSEIQTIGKLINKYITKAIEIQYPIDGVIFSGDFNIDVREMNILQGDLSSILDPNLKLSMNTGLQYQTNFSNNPEPYLKYYENDDKYDLYEAFSSVHQWGNSVGTDLYCTSYNHKRCEWIDMLWYTSKTIEIKNLSNNKTPSKHIPNENYGSDHLPIWIEFDFKS